MSHQPTTTAPEELIDYATALEGAWNITVTYDVLGLWVLHATFTTILDLNAASEAMDKAPRELHPALRYKCELLGTGMSLSASFLPSPEDKRRIKESCERHLREFTRSRAIQLRLKYGSLSSTDAHALAGEFAAISEIGLATTHAGGGMWQRPTD